MNLITQEHSNWSSHSLSIEICRKFVRDNVLVLSETWVNSNHHQIQQYAILIRNWLNKSPENKAISVSFYDQGLVRKKIHMFDVDVSRIRFIDQHDICFWLLVVDKYFLKYANEDLIPVRFNHKFLCYQRKITTHRRKLYDTLKDKEGIVTLGDQKFEINDMIPVHVGLKEAHIRLEMPNDIYSLGNPDIWNTAFLNIVSETNQDFKDDCAFISEKTFKPIIGLRPFICFANPNISKQLKELGFETFDDDFDYRPTDDEETNITMISNIVQNIDFNRLNNDKLYDTYLPKLLHNKNWLPKAAEKQWKKIEELANE